MPIINQGQTFVMLSVKAASHTKYNYCFVFVSFTSFSELCNLSLRLCSLGEAVSCLMVEAVSCLMVEAVSCLMVEAVSCLMVEAVSYLMDEPVSFRGCFLSCRLGFFYILWSRQKAVHCLMMRSFPALLLRLTYVWRMRQFPVPLIKLFPVSCVFCVNEAVSCLVNEAVSCLVDEAVSCLVADAISLFPVSGRLFLVWRSRRLSEGLSTSDSFWSSV